MHDMNNLSPREMAQYDPQTTNHCECGVRIEDEAERCEVCEADPDRIPTAAEGVPVTMAQLVRK